MLRLSVQEEIMQMNCTEMGEGEGEVLERGRLYERYREKREAKLREDWFLRMEAKEAEMCAMWDLFEASSAKHTSTHDSQRLSAVPLHSCATQELKILVEEEEKKSKVSASRNNSTKRISDVDRTTFSMPLTIKENRAPLIPKDRPNTASSISSQSQRSLSRSRTITDKQKKCKTTVKYHQRRNTLGGPAEFRGLQLLDKNCSVGKSFLRKGSGIGPGAGAAIAKQRSSTGSVHLALSQELLTEELKDSQMKMSTSVVRERKKWGTPEKAVLFSGELPQTKGLKKLLLNIVAVGKSKHRESAVSVAVVCA